MSANLRERRIAVVGASSLIGEAVFEELREGKIRHSALHLIEDGRNLGARLEGADGEQLPMQDVATFDFSSVDLVFFCGRAALSQSYAESAAAHAWVIDGSSAFRCRADVPLIAADVNPEALKPVGGAGLIALAGSASVALATALAPLQQLQALERVEVVTYHAVSGSGRGAVEDLAQETVALLSGKEARGRAFGRQIAFNVIPQVDAIEDGVAKEERRIWEETRRLLGLPQLAINVTAARVPVFFGHSLAVHAAFKGPVDFRAAQGALQRGRGLKLLEGESSDEFPTPATLAGAPDRVYVGRFRADITRDWGLNFWLVADNVRKCAAHNAVSAAQILVNRSQ
ncbi:MAG TPA: aspartate-semialdehyde dehydrogenase [Steroidobacteraceae bacterium]|jgi:aspartate-semialdehyde dehydrogenase